MLMLAKDEDTGESMSDQELRDEIMIIFIAGHETTASALSWTFGLLAQHPDVQKKLRDEIVEVLGPDFKHPTFEDMAKLPYTQAIIQESMRIYPPAWIFSRQAKQDDCIGGYDIPKDSIVVMSPYVMHRNLNYWKDPEKFNPDRFLEKTNDQALLDSIPKHAYVPFGGGPRVCIGSGFAMMEAILVLAQVTQTLAFRFSSQDQKIEPEPLVTLRPKGKMKMEVSLY
jgi:cytochrome P450